MSKKLRKKKSQKFRPLPLQILARVLTKIEGVHNIISTPALPYERMTYGANNMVLSFRIGVGDKQKQYDVLPATLDVLLISKTRTGWKIEKKIEKLTKQIRKLSLNY